MKSLATIESTNDIIEGEFVDPSWDLIKEADKFVFQYSEKNRKEVAFIQGKILCAAREKADRDWKKDGFKTGDKAFGDFISKSLNFKDLKEVKRFLLMNFFKAYDGIGIPPYQISLAYELSAPRNKDVFKRAHNHFLYNPISVSEGKDLIYLLLNPPVEDDKDYSDDADRKFKPTKDTIKEDIEKARKENEDAEKRKAAKLSKEDKERIGKKIDEKLNKNKQENNANPPVNQHKMSRGEASGILGISGCMYPNIEVLKVIYRYWSKEYHPDKGGDTQKMSDINKAYEVLK